MKKTLALILAMTLTATMVLAGCSKGGESGGADKPANGEPITIVYGGTENYLMASELADKFNKTHPDIKVEVFNNDKWLGNEEMTKLAATGKMPDIINLQDVVVPTQNDWVIDMKPYFDKDPDKGMLPENFIKYGTVNDKQVMLPSAVFAFGVMVNLDILSANGIAKPEYTWTMDEWTEIVKKTTKKGETAGMTNPNIMHHIPAQMNPKLGWGSFNEETKKYELGVEWEYAVDKVTELFLSNNCLFGYDWMSLGESNDFEEGSTERNDIIANRQALAMEKVGESDPYTAWAKGKVATNPDMTWASGFYKQENYSGFDWDYYPLPLMGNAKESRAPLVVDSIGITTGCKNPEAAYEFVKYLSFSKQGFEDRMQIVKDYDKEALKAKYPNIPEKEFENPLSYSQMPATTDKDIIAQWTEFNNSKPGLKYILERISTAYVDGYKVTPGYEAAYMKTIEKAVFDQVLTGQKTAADLAAELEEKANKVSDEAFATLR